MPNVIRLLMLTVPWFSIAVLPKKSFREYLPVSAFTSLLVCCMCLAAVKNKWWIVRGGWKSTLFNDFSFVFGPFFIGTLWVFHFTFGNFKRYLLANLIMDLVFSYPLNYLLQRLGLYKLVNFKPKHIFAMFSVFSVTIYGCQLLFNRLR
ncbi:hypothetical protein H1D32_02695 [Anaerobacillus sp. CMMVII]|uniref:hypothetical protein n=1 Tax=Anaerobacillus sp. CMMVII TaxID=2755588 RepID=UPI0021B735C5|nr:hypothetical protein [Anaerobacillus sp. CMMVII]MCT8136757.1 hypothetical protein [Anaerobacillus sp. CMMVII]